MQATRDERERWNEPESGKRHIPPAILHSHKRTLAPKKRRKKNVFHTCLNFLSRIPPTSLLFSIVFYPPNLSLVFTDSIHSRTQRFFCLLGKEYSSDYFWMLKHFYPQKSWFLETFFLRDFLIREVSTFPTRCEQASSYFYDKLVWIFVRREFFHFDLSKIFFPSP